MGKRGPATTFDPEYCALARKYCILGATNDKLAEFLGVSVATIGNWLRDFPAFREAVQQGRARADAEVADKLYTRATGYDRKGSRWFQTPDGPQAVEVTQHFAPDTEACKFWLRNRRRDLWNDKVEVEHSASEELIALLEAAGDRLLHVKRP
jgi:transcriptional regulator with XRE-family HTH domain